MSAEADVRASEQAGRRGEQKVYFSRHFILSWGFRIPGGRGDLETG
jgi:hypothetical protein